MARQNVRTRERIAAGEALVWITIRREASPAAALAVVHDNEVVFSFGDWSQAVAELEKVCESTTLCPCYFVSDSATWLV